MATALGISGNALDSLFTLDPVSTNAPNPFPGPITFRKALSTYMDLDACPSPAALAVFADCLEDSDAEASEKLAHIAANAQVYQQWVATEHPRWRDIWTLCPSLQGRLPVERLFELCPTTAPRYYCISSSLLATPEEVAVTVGQVAFHLPDGRKRKVCNTFIVCECHIIEEVSRGGQA
jgi:sulfite reductase alpha subunit-like flavoprotein